MTHSQVLNNPDPLPLTGLPKPGPMRRLDYVLLALFSFALFGFAMFSGNSLSLHSARLPECSREMMANHDWLIPRSGGRPWLERPPFPHWVMVATSAVLGQHCDSVWVVRLPAALAGTSIVLMTAWIAGMLFGRRTGVCSGFILATAFEFWRYSTLSEDDIFLAMLVVAAIALFVRSEFVEPPASDTRESFAGGRPWTVLLFFIVTGLTNLAKGPLVGAAVVIAPIGAFFLLPPNWPRIRRYVWLWGIAAFVALTLFWPYAIYRRYPDTIHNWLFDYSTTDQFNQPVWYYALQLPGVFMPWTPAVIVGLWLTRANLRQPRVKFLWCWALVPIFVLSLPHRKHHHYLVPSLAPWAVLGAIGLQHIGAWLVAMPRQFRKPALGLFVYGIPGALILLLLHRKIPGPMWATSILAATWAFCVWLFYRGLQLARQGVLLAAVLTGLAVTYCWGERFLYDDTAADTAFLLHANSLVASNVPLMVNGDLGGENGPHGELDFFRNQFYSRPDARLLHNLTFLRDENLHAPQVYLITRASDQAKLELLGTTQIISRSLHTRRQKSDADQFALILLRFKPDLVRYPAPSMDSITTMQAMGRAEGPFCGPK